MKNTLCARRLLIGLILSLAGGTQAAPNNMATLSQTTPPIGHYEFCRNNPDDCGANGGDRRPMAMTDAQWNRLLEVNNAVNGAIEPLPDQQIYGVAERWAYPVSVGDCEDYVLLKRKILMKSGISAANLLITVVLRPDGEAHAVLTVRTKDGDFILDNMRSNIRLWSHTDYVFLKRQSSIDQRLWLKLDNSHGRAVASLK